MAYLHLAAQHPEAVAELTYEPVGATAGRLPVELPGALCVRRRIGRGADAFAYAARELATWRVHGAMGVALSADAAEAAPGVRVEVALGPRGCRVRGACRVVWTQWEARCAGWAYGTLPDHPVRGEEAFTVRLLPDGDVLATVTAFSAPAVWWVRAALPLVRLFQRGYAHWYLHTLRRLVRNRPEPHGTHTDEPDNPGNTAET